MKTIQTTLLAAAALGLAIPASTCFGQSTGTSHPEAIPVTTSDDGVRQPIVYSGAQQNYAGVLPNQALPANLPSGYVPTPMPSAKPSATIPYSSTPELTPRPIPAPSGPVDGLVVGDPLPPRVNSPEATRLLSADVDANVVSRVDGPSDAMPVGTIVKTRLLDELSTASTAEGSEWHAELVDPLTRDGKVLVPAGTILRGKVTEVVGGKRINGQAAIHLTAISITLPDGSTRGIHAQVIDTSLYGKTKVNSEGTILHRSNKKMEAGVLGLTTGSGAAAGAMIAGVPGALVGAGIGAGVSTAIWLKQDHQTSLPRETEITFELTRAISFGHE